MKKNAKKEIIDVKVTTASIYHKDDKAYVKLTFNTYFKGIAKTDDDEYIETDINSITFPYFVFMHKMESLLRGFKLYVTGWEERKRYKYSSAALTAFLTDANLVLKRTKFTPEDTYITSNGEEVHYNGVKFDTEFYHIKLSKVSQDAFDRTYSDLL